MSRVLRRIAGRGGSTSERKAYARAVQLYPRRYDKAEKRSWPILTRCFVELSTAPELIRKLVPTHAEAELKSAFAAPALAAYHLTDSFIGNGIDVDNFVPIPIEQLRISLDVSNTSFTGKTMFLNTFRPSSAVTRPLLAARLPELFELCD